MRKLIEEDGGPLTFICLSVLVHVHTHISIYISTTHVHIQILSHIKSKTIRHWYDLNMKKMNKTKTDTIIKKIKLIKVSR